MNMYKVGRSDRMSLRTKPVFNILLKSWNLPIFLTVSWATILSGNYLLGHFLAVKQAQLTSFCPNNLITTLEAGILDPLSSLQTMYVLHKSSLCIHTNLEIARVILYIIYWNIPISMHKYHCSDITNNNLNLVDAGAFGDVTDTIETISLSMSVTNTSETSWNYHIDLISFKKIYLHDCNVEFLPDTE